jgi:gamma-glutamylcyclotransferase (GGCT)/AIG2-like uncharacterized protein YtfP
MAPKCDDRLHNAKWLGVKKIQGYKCEFPDRFDTLTLNKKGDSSAYVSMYEIDDRTEEILDYYEGFRKDNPKQSLYLKQEIEFDGKKCFYYKINEENIKQYPVGNKIRT